MNYYGDLSSHWFSVALLFAVAGCLFFYAWKTADRTPRRRPVSYPPVAPGLRRGESVESMTSSRPSRVNPTDTQKRARSRADRHPF